MMDPRSALRLESVSSWMEQHGFHLGERGFFAAALERPWGTFEGQELYPGVWLKSAAILDSVISTHPFIDGNKRAGVLLAVLVLRAYGFPVTQTSSDDWFELAVWVAVDHPDIQEIADRLRKVVHGDPGEYPRMHA